MSPVLAGLFAFALYLSSTGIVCKQILSRNTDAHTNVQATPGPYPSEHNRRRSPRRHRPEFLLAIAALLAHAIALGLPIFEAGALNLAFFQALSISAWLTVSMMLLLSTSRPVMSLSVLVFPLAAVCALLGTLLANRTPVDYNSGLQLHILSSVIAYSLLSMAAAQSVLVAVQENRLRQHRPGIVLNFLPPLTVMERILFELLVAVLAVLSIALLSGFLYAEDLFAQRLVHKTTLSILSWVILCVLLIGHVRLGWRGHTAAKMTLGAFSSLLLGYFGSKLVIELILGQGT